MKIDDESINHNAVRLIKELIGDIYEYVDNDKSVALTLAGISGILNMADVMKQVLKV